MPTRSKREQKTPLLWTSYVLEKIKNQLHLEIPLRPNKAGHLLSVWEGVLSNQFTQFRGGVQKKKRSETGLKALKLSK